MKTQSLGLYQDRAFEGTYDAILIVETGIVVFGPAWGYPLRWGESYDDQWELPLNEFEANYVHRTTY